MGTATADIGLVGLAVMGQNLALNVAEKVICKHILKGFRLMDELLVRTLTSWVSLGVGNHHKCL